MLFGRKRETPEEKQERLRKAYEGMAKACEQGKDKYDAICVRVGEILQNAEKPGICNKVRFMSEAYLFPKLKSYQLFDTDWEIWRTNDKLYLYCKEVEDYPEDYYSADAPEIGVIDVSDIQQFRIEGSTFAETKVSGGKVFQDKRTGKIHQEAIKSSTIQRDTRLVKLTLLVNGIVKDLDFDYNSYDVLRALIPEKES